VAVTSDGRRAVCACDDTTLRLWDLDSGEELRALVGHTHDVWAVAVTPDGRRAISGSRDTTVRIWDLESGEQLRALEVHTDSVDAVAVTWDGRRAISGSCDNTLRVWDLEPGALLCTFTADAPVVSCAVASDGRTIVAGDGIGRVHFLRLEGL
jgi:WD40 repeat protein